MRIWLFVTFPKYAFIICQLVKSELVKSGQIKHCRLLSHDRSIHYILGQDRSNQERSSQERSSQDRLSKGKFSTIQLTLRGGARMLDSSFLIFPKLNRDTPKNKADLIALLCCMPLCYSE